MCILLISNFGISIKCQCACMECCLKFEEKTKEYLKNWQYLLERRQGKDHKFQVVFPSSEQCVVSWRCQTPRMSSSEQNKRKCGLSEGTCPAKQKDHYPGIC